MKTETLIHNLAMECQPVKPLANPTVRFFKWALASAVIVTVQTLIWRPNFHLDFLFDASFVLPAAFILCASFISALSAFILTIPDIKNRKFYLLLVASIISWFCAIIYYSMSAHPSDSNAHYFCVWRTIKFALLPSLLLFYMLRKGAPVKSGIVGLLASLSALLFATMGVQIVCQNLSLAHLIVWHLLPVSVLSGIGFFLGRLVFKWNRRR